MFITFEESLRLLLAVIIGGLIGLERETRAKSAGFRTLTLICFGATLFTIVSLKSGDTRTAANIVPGIGFLGAGAILRDEGRIKGLTTASSIWVAAALGMAIGFGAYVLAAVATALVIIVLEMFGQIDRWIDQRVRIPRTYEITFVNCDDKQEQIVILFKQAGMPVAKIQRSKRQGQCVVELEAVGRMVHHEQITARLIADPDIVAVHF